MCICKSCLLIYAHLLPLDKSFVLFFFSHQVISIEVRIRLSLDLNHTPHQRDLDDRWQEEPLK